MFREKRAAARKCVKNFGEVVFCLQGELYFGSIMNLSPSGLCISVHATGFAANQIPSAGKKFDCCITGEWGTSKCKAEIRWAVAESAMIRAGLSLLKVPDEEDDPWLLMLRRHYRIRMARTRTAPGGVTVSRRITASHVPRWAQSTMHAYE